MPARKSTASAASNGAEDGAESTPAKSTKDGLSVEDLSLPKSMIARLAKGVLPANTQIHKDALLALHKSATVFVSYIASTSNENAQSSGKKTISPQDVIAAMKDAEFEEFLPRLEAELKKYNETQCDKRNTYRRKVKEEKAAIDVDKEDDAHVEGVAAGVTNGETNGHAEADVEAEDGERLSKKFKAENGTAMAPNVDVDGLEDDDIDGEQDGGQDAEDHEDDEVEDEDEGDDDEEDEDEDGRGAVLVGRPDPDDTQPVHDMRDEALDDPDSDSD